MDSRTRVLLAFSLLLATAVGRAAGVEEIENPAGPGSLAPALAELDDGQLVLTWLEPDGGGHALKFSILTAAEFGPAKVIARGQGWFANWADTPGLFVLPNGDWVAHWLVRSGPSTYAYDVVMARSSDRGRTWSKPLSPHDDGTATEHGFVSYYPAGADRVGVVWLDGRNTADAGAEHAEDHDGHGQAGAMTLRTAVLGPGLEKLEEHLLDDRVCDCCQTAAALSEDGPVVVYRDRGSDEIRDHYVTRGTEQGWSEPVRLHADNWRIDGCPVNGPAMVADGRQLAVAWFTMAGGEPRVHVAASSDGGRSFESVQALGLGTALGRVDLALTDRGFLLSWVDQPDRSGVLVLAEYDWSGREIWREQVDGLDAGRASGFPRIGVLAGCRPVVAWTGISDGERHIRVVVPAPRRACRQAGRG